MMYRVINTTKEVIYDNITSYEEAWTILEQTKLAGSYENLDIEEYKKPITGLGRDPDLH